MDDQELDEWFSQEREKLESSYYDGAQAGKDLQKLKVAFDTGLKRLLASYQKKQVALYAKQRRDAAIRAPIAKYRAWSEERQQSFHDSWLRGKQAIRTWLFHQKIKWILRRK